MTVVPRHSWRSVRDIIHGRIMDSTFGPGDKLPRDEDLADEFGCARATVQRAMRDLAESGVVERRRKGGTHVRPDPVTRATLDIPITRREVEQRGSTYGYQLIQLEEAEIPYRVAANFELPLPRTMLRVEAVHLADRRPYIYEDRWICTDTVPDIRNIDLSVHSANEWLVRNKPYNRCDLRFYAERAGEYYGRLFGADANEALFVMERTTWQNGAPITSVKAVTGPGYQLLTQT
ncbi:MAG: GntR family transcriptional regulator [Rhizobiaceae bacterium]